MQVKERLRTSSILNQMKFSFWGPCGRSPHNSVLPSASHLGSVREYKLGKKNKAKCSVLLLKRISLVYI